MRVDFTFVAERAGNPRRFCDNDLTKPKCERWKAFLERESDDDSGPDTEISRPLICEGAENCLLSEFCEASPSFGMEGAATDR